MEVRAHLRYLRMSPRKVRLVVDLIRGLTVDQALTQLSILPKAAARPVRKLVESAVANAKHNWQLDPKSMLVKAIMVNQGPRLKRFRARAFGRAAEISKDSCHITVVLEDQAKTDAPATKTGQPTTSVTDQTVKKEAAKPKLSIKRIFKKSQSSDPVRRRAATDVTIARKGDS